jgi:nucleoside-diphosphate-sugar epimerase
LSTTTKLIFGCGYLGQRVAERWKNSGHRVTIITRSAERAQEFRRTGYEAIVADITKSESLRQLPKAETVLYSVGYDRKSTTPGSSIEEVYAGGVRHVLAALDSNVSRFIYISTTGVYGAGDGDWVDETTPTDPQRDGGRASLAAEQLLAASSLKTRGVILRLAGLYGPGRVPFLDELHRGEPIPAISTGYLNLIYVDDAADVVVAAAKFDPKDFLTTNPGPRIYCASDGHPVERGEYYSEVARQIGMPPPSFIAPNPNSPRAQRAASSRRISNERMLNELRVTLAYPDYRCGLTASLGA